MLVQSKPRFVLIALAGLSLLAGLWTGTLRLGWSLPALNVHLPLLHGPLMVLGFLGTLIGLERAVALHRVWPYAAPIFSGLGLLSVLTGLPIYVGAVLAIMASFLLTAVFGSLYLQSPSAHFVTMGLSGGAWFVGNCLWLAGLPLYAVTPWWAGFLVLMIAGERLELSRTLRPSWRTRALFHLSTAIVLAGLSFSLLKFAAGIQIAGIGLTALSIWLLRYDIAWRTVREINLPRYMAICLLSGYLWLCVGGILWIIFAYQFNAGPRYDAMLHSIFLGFVFSMIFGHAPIILPSVTGIALPFQRSFYFHLSLLHVSLLLRVAGDLTLWMSAQKWGGLLNVLAVLVFLINNIYAAKGGVPLVPERRPSSVGVRAP